MSEGGEELQQSMLRNIEREVGELLESDFQMDSNKKEKVVSGYFSKGFLPQWYFFSNNADTIAHHIYMLTQFLNANRDMLSQTSRDGKVVTYFVNIGRDSPGRLYSIFQENSEMDIISYDSEQTASGLRIVTLQKRGGSSYLDSLPETPGRLRLEAVLLKNAVVKGYKHASLFTASLPSDYVSEELMVDGTCQRSLRHLALFEDAINCQAMASNVSNTEKKEEIRISFARINPGKQFVSRLLELFRKKGSNLGRSYYDEFPSSGGVVGILSAYLTLPKEQADLLTEEIRDEVESLFKNDSQDKKSNQSRHSLDHKIEQLVRSLSSVEGESFSALLEEINLLTADNQTAEGEMGSFYLNSLTDFMEAVRFLGLEKNNKLMKEFLGFESTEEFFVSCKKNGVAKNIPGYRFCHSRKRGPAKGGLRIDPIADFTEVAALSFMMTWKSARSGILFGGAKGGLMLNKRDYATDSLELFDSLSNFGRSLFLVTGPAKDVPAGDVGCGPVEIGILFEGFKSALRDLALMVYGVKNNVSRIGDQVISLHEARKLLKEAFDIDYSNVKLVRELAGNHEYLERVAAAQVTGKPKMGINARNGATGRGLVYATLATVTNLYLNKRWECEAHFDKKQMALLQKVAAIESFSIRSGGGKELLSDSQWAELNNVIYPLLLKDKKVVIQGSGKVGSSLLKELEPFGVNFIAVADAGGAVIGDHLDPNELLEAVLSSRENTEPGTRATIMQAQKNVTEKIPGAREGAAILELECDILFPAALENAVNGKNAHKIQAKIEVCGSNGSNSSAAEKILHKAGITVVYDFLANSGGVIASYFEWLRNLEMRYRYEAEVIMKQPFDPTVLHSYIMPEFSQRIEAILLQPESEETTRLWNHLIRDIIFKAVNEDFNFAQENKISLKTAGFVHAIKEYMGEK